MVTSQTLTAKEQEDKGEEGSLFCHFWPYGHHKYKVTVKTHAEWPKSGCGVFISTDLPNYKSDIYEIQVRLQESTCLVVFHCIPTNNVVTMESVTHINPKHIVF